MNKKYIITKNKMIKNNKKKGKENFIYKKKRPLERGRKKT
jgi:hypothetical protein